MHGAVVRERVLKGPFALAKALKAMAVLDEVIRQVTPQPHPTQPLATPPAATATPTTAMVRHKSQAKEKGKVFRRPLN